MFKKALILKVILAILFNEQSSEGGGRGMDARMGHDEIALSSH